MGVTGFEFEADFPDDTIEEGEGEDWRVVRPGGMAMAHAVADLLRSAGIGVSELEPDLEHHCWVFTAEKDRKCYPIYVYDLSVDKLIMVHGSSPWFKHLFDRRDVFVECLETLYGLLSSDPRFSSVGWVDVNGRPIAAP